MTVADRTARVAGVIAGVVQQAVTDANAAGIMVIDDGSTEARLTRDWCALAVGPECVNAVTVDDLAAAGFDAGALALLAGNDGVEELQRAVARIRAAARNALLAHPANKTALLLGAAVPPEPLLPLGDIYASRISEITGSFSIPAIARSTVEAAGGITVVDSALAALIEGRQSSAVAFANIPDPVAAELLALLERGRFLRRRAGLVPKIGARTIGVDLLV